MRIHDSAALQALCIGIASALPAACPAAPLELRWRAEASDPKPYPASVYRGETVALSAALYAYNAPVALAPASACTLYWQTNGMGSAWWTCPGAASTNGTLSAVWSPTNDVGAALYAFFLSAETPSGRIYRARGTIRMLPSPGFEPNALPLPVQTLDFSSVSFINAPWATTNALAGALQSASSTNALFSAWFGSLFSSTSRWDAAYAWGDWHSSVSLKLDAADTNGWETGSHASFLTSAPPQSVVSVNGQTGAVVITAESIGALTNETDLAALRTYHYGSPDIVESPAEWFVFNGAGTITGINSASVTNWNIVIPWAIGGVPVTTIGDDAFYECVSLTSVTIGNSVTSIGDHAFRTCTSLTSVTIPDSVTEIGYQAFYNCTSLASVTVGNSVIFIGNSAFSGCTLLTSVTIPDSVTSIGPSAFLYCTSLTSVTIPDSVTEIRPSAFSGCTLLTSLYFDGNAPTIGPDIFFGIPANQVTNYVTNPQATGWGETLGGMPVVRLPLYGDKIYQAGELVATTGYVAQAIAAIPEPDLSGKADVQDGVATNLSTHGWLALPQTQATNLTYRLVTSNDVILAIGVWE